MEMSGIKGRLRPFRDAAIEPLRQMRRPGPATLEDIRSQLGDLKYSNPPAPWARLTPRTPHVADRGHLNYLLPRSVHTSGDHPTASWLAMDGEAAGVDGHLEIWLSDLDPDTQYVIDLELGSMGNGEFKFHGSFGWSSAPAKGGVGHHYFVVVPAGQEHGTALLRVFAPGVDWLFWSATVSD